ncbi:hypothetical protein [Mesorhizobium sp.]|uniref:hypothetical protein n=1 Tax=Mesorhizobium sp. TaxID=1871066 RepID=UPI000FE4AE21|nr:hypothetical protein [Mesorhizobium sp.]RWO18974.1 MAG: hypothetical protein EOS09_33210 [Mesorhizobium sp.]
MMSSTLSNPFAGKVQYNRVRYFDLPASTRREQRSGYGGIVPGQDEFIDSWLAPPTVLVVGLVSERTATLSHIASHFHGPAGVASNCRRVQLFHLPDTGQSLEASPRVSQQQPSAHPQPG